MTGYFSRGRRGMSFRKMIHEIRRVKPFLLMTENIFTARFARFMPVNKRYSAGDMKAQKEIRFSNSPSPL
jgi:hypothetical protein